MTQDTIEDVEMSQDGADEEESYKPAQEDIILVVVAASGDLEKVKNLVEEDDADICFQVETDLLSNTWRHYLNPSLYIITCSPLFYRT